MKILVPHGESKVLHFTLTPEEPTDGKAADWKLVCNSENPSVHIDELKMRFSLDSSPAERAIETLTLKIGIDSSVQTSETAWQFAGTGLMFANDKGDFKGCFSLEQTNDCSQLVVSVKCLDIDGESFKFSFLAMHTNLVSGECKIFASADPIGDVGRGD